MPWGGYSWTQGTFNHKCSALYNGDDYKWKDKNCWYNFNIYVTVAADGTISYTITSTNNIASALGVSWSHCNMSAWIEINGETILSTGYYTNSNSFPKKNNSSISGTLSSKASEGSVSIKTKILTASNYAYHTTDFNNSLLTSSLPRNSWYYDNGGSPTISSIYCKENNGAKAVITGTVPNSVTNNALNSATLYWTTNGTTPKPGATGTNHTTLSINSGFTKEVTITKKTSQVKAKVVCDYQRGNDTSASLTGTMYTRPDTCGNPVINYNKTRFTLKEPWTISWTASTANANAPIGGYRIRLTRRRKNSDGTWGAWANIKMYNTSGTLVSHDNSNGDWVYDTGNTNTTFTLNPALSDIQPGDEIHFSIFGYCSNPWLWAGTANGIAGISETKTVQNAGIMRVKQNNAWKEGQVWIKAGNQWKEADVVKIKTGGTWKESE